MRSTQPKRRTVGIKLIFQSQTAIFGETSGLLVLIFPKIVHLGSILAFYYYILEE
jgi:hypothetical protein